MDTPENGHKQFATASLDGTVAFWDLRYKKDIKSLDLVWRPFLRVQISALDNSYDYSVTQVSLNTIMSSIIAPKKSEEDKVEKKIKTWTSKFFCATEEGDLLYCDWMSEKTTDEKVSRVDYLLTGHFGSLSDLDRSPFFPDLVLSAGGWTFHIWREKNSVLYI